jgi:hypothetical protein
MVTESVRAIIRSRRGKPVELRRPGSHTWFHGLPFKIRFKRSRIYVSAIPVWAIGFTIGFIGGTDHATPYTYDTHVPLAFYGLPFQPGTYHTPAEPVDLAVTLASLLGINAPSHAIGRVLTEALAAPRRVPGSAHGGEREERSAPDVERRGFRPAASSGAEAAREMVAVKRADQTLVEGPR